MTALTASSLQPKSVLKALGLTPGGENPGVLPAVAAQQGTKTSLVASFCPSTGQTLGHVQEASVTIVPAIVDTAHKAYESFRNVPAPQRGVVLRAIREELVLHKDALGALISLEMGKILAEGIGEVQEAIDICDYAVGLSRMLAGTVLPSERENHFLMEVNNPLGVVLVISAFNFPHAVFFWNFALSFICGNATIWKPSPTTSLIAIATTKIIHTVLERLGHSTALATLVCGDTEVSQALTSSPKIPLVSFTGSEKTGSIVGAAVQSRLGRVILELGGNNAVVVMPDADQELALRTVVFGAVGTAGQRCTTTRRLLIHSSIAETFLSKLSNAYSQIRIGDPLEKGTLMGPLHSKTAVDQLEACLKECEKQGSKVVARGKLGQMADGLKGGNWVVPVAVFHGNKHPSVMDEECFAPILHVATFETLEEAVKLNNSVRQGLSSSLFTNDMKNVYKWTSASGSDCGIVNVNQSTSGAEIGCPFGGNKATGGGRESGGDAWKQYVRWSSCTINYGGQLGLAQGIKFE